MEYPIVWDEAVDGPVPVAPRINRFYPAARGIRALFRERARWALVVPNRADRRANKKGH